MVFVLIFAGFEINRQLNCSSLQVLYDQNLDLLQFKHDMELLEQWMNCREDVVSDQRLGDSIDAVEELLRKHIDFEKLVDAQAEKFDTIKRITKVGFSLLSNPDPGLRICLLFVFDIIGIIGILRTAILS